MAFRDLFRSAQTPQTRPQTHEEIEFEAYMGQVAKRGEMLRELERREGSRVQITKPSELQPGDAAGNLRAGSDLASGIVVERRGSEVYLLDPSYGYQERGPGEVTNCWASLDAAPGFSASRALPDARAAAWEHVSVGGGTWYILCRDGVTVDGSASEDPTTHGTTLTFTDAHLARPAHGESDNVKSYIVKRDDFLCYMFHQM